MQVYNFVINHWAEIGVVYLIVLKVLTAVQDAVDAEPSGLKPPFGKVLYYIKAIGGYLGLGNRPQSIGGSNAQVTVSSSVSDGINVVK